MNTKVPVEVAAGIIHKSPTFLRWALQNNRAPFGFASQVGKRWSYFISSKMFSDYTGVSVKELEEMTEAYREKYKLIMKERRA
jgi:alkyl hydroperoxide reductase subunit AhpC